MHRVQLWRLRQGLTIKQKVTVGIRERVIIDLAKEGAVTRKDLAKEKPSPCVAAIEDAIYENTCRAEGVKRLGQKLDKLHQTCAASWSKNTDLLLEMATWQAAYVYPERCYYNDEIKKMPDFLTSWSVGDNFWPKGTLKSLVSSWSWARQPEEDLFSKYSGQPFRDKVKQWVNVWAERQTVVDQLVDVALNPKMGIPAATAASAQAKFDMNPTTPAGHRNFGLSVLAQWNPEIAKDPAVAKVLAQGASKAGQAKGGNVHCGLMPESTNLVEAMIADQEISPDDWAAIQGFLKRTPKDATMRGCRSVIDARLKGVATTVRFATFAFYDCAKGRDEEQRGKTISSMIDPAMSPELIPPPERVKLLKKFRDCIAYENGTDTEQPQKKKFKGYDVERYQYESGDLRRISIRETGNMGGKTFDAYYRPDGRVTRVVCGPAYKYSVAECKGQERKSFHAAPSSEMRFISLGSAVNLEVLTGHR